MKSTEDDKNILITKSEHIRTFAGVSVQRLQVIFAVSVVASSVSVIFSTFIGPVHIC
jgi:hypothetical protein